MSQQTLSPQVLSAIASGETFPNLVKLENACARAIAIWPDWKADFVTIRKKYYTEETAKYGVTILQSASEKLLALNTDEARKIVELGLTWEKPSNNMKDAKHTPGPWQVEKGSMIVPSSLKGDPICLFFGRDEIDFNNTPANANLIAAAPDLLKEMERMLVVIQHIEDELPATWAEATQGTGIATSNAYRLAIAKAKGEII